MKNIVLYFLSGALFLTSAFAELSVRDDVVDVALKVEYGVGYSTIYFKDYHTIKNLAGILNKYPDSKVDIFGHTDSVGKKEVNQELSEARAQNIKNLLIKYDVGIDRISTKGFSENKPIASNSTKLGRSKNRRSVIRVIGLKADQNKEFRGLINVSSALDLLPSNKGDLNSENTEPSQGQIVSDDSVKESAKEPMDSTQDLDAGERKVTSENIETLNQSTAEYNLNSTEDRKNAVLGFFMPNWSSQYYGGNVNFEHGKLSPLGIGVGFKREFNNYWYGKMHAYYLPTEVNRGTSGINFTASDSIDYENNIYGIGAGYVFRSKKASKISVEAFINSHIIGGLERTSALNYIFDKYNHVSLGLGLNYQKTLFQKWKLNGSLSYLIPISVSEVRDFSGKLWYRGGLGVNRDLGENLSLNFEYKVIYHETEFRFANDTQTTPEFLIQTFLMGLGYKF